MTNTQRRRKVVAAKKRIAEARELLAEVADDYTAHSYLLSHSEWDDRRAVLDLLVPLERMRLEPSGGIA